MNIRTFVAFLSQNLQYNFPKMRGGVKGYLEFFRKFIRSGNLTRPLDVEHDRGYFHIVNCHFSVIRP